MFCGGINVGDSFLPAVFDFGPKFLGAASFNGNLTAWRPISAKTMSKLFAGTKSFTGSMGDLSNWKTPSVRDLSHVFELSSYLGSLSKWNTSQVTDFSYMFYASHFIGDISRWDVRNGDDFSFACKFMQTVSCTSKYTN
jgi:Mycoplasma protein of unknown function, DUF285